MMTKMVIGIAAVALSQVTPAVLSSDKSAVEKLTLEQALEIAVGNSYSVKGANATVKRADQSVNEALSRLGFTLNSNVNYLRYGFEQVANIGGQNVVFQPLDQTTVGATLGYQFDLSGNNRRQIQAARRRREASKYTKLGSVNDVRQGVRRAFYGVLRAKALLQVNEQALKNIEVRVDQAQKQYAQGVTAKIDVDRFTAQKVAAEGDVIVAKNQVVLAKQALNLSLDRPIETEVDVEDSVAPITLQSEMEALVRAGQVLRPEVKSLRENIEAQKGIRRAAMQTLEPTLNFQLNYNRTLDPAGLNPQRELTTTTLVLSLPIWDTGATKARVKQAEEDINLSQFNLEQLKLAISQEIRTAVVNFKTAQTRIASAEAQVTVAKEVARLARIRRDAGEATVLEIIDAETALTQAENVLVNARYDALLAYADLQRAVGNDNLTAALAESEKQAKAGSK